MQLLPDTRSDRSGSTRGFTLIELVMVIVIVGVLGSVAAGAIVESTRVVVNQRTSLEGSHQVQFLLDRLRDDLRAIRASDPYGSVEADRLEFATTDDETVVYEAAGSTLTRNGRELATGLVDFVFGYRATDGSPTLDPAAVHLIEIDFVVVRGGQEFPGSAVAYPRAVAQ